ncbi:MAG: hypothetical protein PHH77_11055 [Victivallaceae bacterium]|nr:hypothetical protein [Victivallaceae bacterium]
MIDTLAFIGYREAFDDIKYATKLKEEITKAKNIPEKANIAHEAEQFLEGQDYNSYYGSHDPNWMRLQIIQYLLKLIK